MLFRGKIAGLDLLLYPQEVAGIHVDQNRFLLKFEVTDINHILNLALTRRRLLNAPVDNDGTKAAAVATLTATLSNSNKSDTKLIERVCRVH